MKCPRERTFTESQYNHAIDFIIRLLSEIMELEKRLALLASTQKE